MPQWYDEMDHEHDQHVTPAPQLAEEREHELSVNCWCEPRRDTVEPSVIIHNRVAQA